MAPENTSPSSMNGLKGYSDFFASGLRTVGKELTNRRSRQRSRPASYCSTISTTTTTTSDSEYSAALIVYPWLPFEDQAPPSTPTTYSKRRPTSMLISGTSSPRSQSREGRTRRTFSHLSHRLWDHLSLFPAVPEPSTPTTPTTPTQKSNQRKFASLTEIIRPSSEKPDVQDIWNHGDDSYPSTPVSNILPKHRRMSTFDPFGSLPDSKSFFVDFPESPSPCKRASKPRSETSFLLMPKATSSPSTPTRPVSRSPTGPTFSSCDTTTTASSANAFVKLTQQEHPRTHRRKRSVQAASHSRQSSLQSHHHTQATGQGDYCIPEEEEPVQGHFCEKRDPAASIDWRQFHSDLMDVEV